VKPYRKANKNDFIDAEAIAEAVNQAKDALCGDQNPGATRWRFQTNVESRRVSFPTEPHGSRNLCEIAGVIANRMIGIFTQDEHGRRPIYGGTKMFQEDPCWKDLILFYEFYHGDNGAGLGASHQTGWSALVAALIEDWRR
jgi:hypothetical protein